MSSDLFRIDGTTGARRHFRYFDYVMAAFVAILLLSNLIGASKLSVVDVSWLSEPTAWLPWDWLLDDGKLVFGAGILFFPLSYVIGDLLTEVYGYANARRCVWTGFIALLFMAFMSWVVVAMPPAAGWGGQAAYESVFGNTWRIVAASVLAFWAGEFVNSYVLARMKVWTGGKKLWTRTIGSTVFGQAVDSAIFYPVAFLGTWTTEQVVSVMVVNWFLKVLWEALLTPVTYAVVGWVKAREGVDVYDQGTDFSPFAKTKAL
ncbi:MAG TPA: queuosine precursor transporter [Novosphingobium sp.]|nr:queuosine precursor transporter [Novosphingobium sp.]